MDYFRSIFSFPSLVFLFGALLVFESHCTVHTVSLFTRFKDIVLAGESIQLICSVSDTNPEDDITLLITDGISPNFEFEPVPGVTVYTQQTITDIMIESNRTFTCVAVGANIAAQISLTISPLPNKQTHCTTDYTDGIIVGQTVTLTCYSSTSMSGSISWSSDSDTTFEEVKSNIRSMTTTNKINVQPSVSQNGTVFTCERDGVAPVSDIDRCTVGPINVYEKLIIFIDPIVTTTDPAILYPGQTKNYTCSSLPTSSVQWSVSKKLNDSGIEVSVIGSKITVTVRSDSNFTGDVELFCSGTILTESSIANLTLVINPMESSTKTPATEKVHSDEPNIGSLLYIVICASGGLLALVIVLILCCVCLKCKGNTSPTIKPDPGKQAPIPVPEYDLAPFGSGERQAVPNADENQINGNDPNAAEDGKESYAVVSKKGNENEEQTTASGVLLPPPSTESESGVSSHSGKDNGGFMKTDEVNTGEQYGEEDYSTIKKDRMSVKYTAPDKKIQEVVDNSQNEELEETDTTPSYAVVNKSRHIVIDEDMLDDEDDDEEDDEYWEH